MLARLQGFYFLLTGVWPLLNMRTFEAVTGPKVDRWLVKTVGVLVGVIGLSLLRAERRPSATTTTLAVGSAAGLGAIDLIYASRGRISRVYLLDAVLELLLLLAWARRRAQRPQAPGARPSERSSERSMVGAARRSRSR